MKILQVFWETPKAKNYLPRTVERKRIRYTTNRSWTGQFRQQNMPGTLRRKVFVEPIGKWCLILMKFVLKYLMSLHRGLELLPR